MAIVLFVKNIDEVIDPHGKSDPVLGVVVKILHQSKVLLKFGDHYAMP